MVRRRYSIFGCEILALVLALVVGVFGQTAAPRSTPLIQRSFVQRPAVPSAGDWSQLGKLGPGPGGFTIYFASTVAESGDTIVVGAQADVSNSRAAYIFVKSAPGWMNAFPVAALSIPTPQNLYGSAIAIDGDTVVVGAPTLDTGSPSYAYVYIKPKGGWVDMKPTAILSASDSLDGVFGSSVAINGNTIVVGDSGYGSSAGAAYVYVKPSAGWSDSNQTAKLTASDGLLNDELGFSSAISGTTVVVGAPQFDTGAGKTYVFVEPASGWKNMTQTAELTGTGNFIGRSVAIDGNVVLAGASSGEGAAFLFVESAGGWTDMLPTATLLPGDVQQNGSFGYCVGISGNLAIVGAPTRSLGTLLEGGIYVFQKPSGGWKNMSSATVLTGSDARYGGWFGSAAAIEGKTVVGGAPYFREPGAAYIFGLP